MPVLSFVIPVVFIGLAGLVYVFSGSIFFGLKGGLLSAIVASIAVTISSFLNGYNSINSIIISIGMLYLIGIGLGKTIDFFRAQKKKLLEQKQLLEGVLNSIPDVIGIQKPDHTIEMYNQMGYKMLDISQQEAKGKKCYELLGKNSECKSYPTRKALQSKDLESVEKYVLGLDRYLHCRSNPVINDEGKIIRIIEQLRDITDRKKAENKLKKISKEYEIILSNVQNAIFLINVINKNEFRYQRLNNLHERLTGLSGKKVRGKTPVEVLDKDLGNKIERNYRKCLIKRETITYEEKLSLPAGKRIWLTKSTPVIIDNKVEKIVGTSLDITENKKYQENIKYLSFQDEMAGLYNRRYFENEIDRLNKL